MVARTIAQKMMYASLLVRGGSECTCPCGERKNKNNNKKGHKKNGMALNAKKKTGMRVLERKGGLSGEHTVHEEPENKTKQNKTRLMFAMPCKFGHTGAAGPVLSGENCDRTVHRIEKRRNQYDGSFVQLSKPVTLTTQEEIKLKSPPAH